MTKIYTCKRPTKEDINRGGNFITTIEFYERERRGKIYYGVIFNYFVSDKNCFTSSSKKFNSKEEGNNYFKEIKRNVKGLKLKEIIDE